MPEGLLNKVEKLRKSGKLSEEQLAKLDTLAANYQQEAAAPVAPEVEAPKPVGATMAGMMLDPVQTAQLPESEITSDIELAHQAEIDRGYIQPNEALHGQSQSNKRKVFSPPVVQAIPAQPGENRIERPPFRFYEPDVGRVVQWAKDNDMPHALRDLQDNGTRSSFYKEIADKMWSDVAETFTKHGQGAIRVAFQNTGEDSEVPLLEQARGSIDRSMDALFTGFDSMATMGAGRHALGALQDESPAEKELQARGLIGSPADRMKEAADRNILLSTMGMIPGMLGPGAGKLLFGKLAPPLGKAVGPVTGTAVPAFLQGAGEQAVEEVAGDGGEGGGERVLKRGLDYGTLGGLFGLGGELLGSLGKAASKKVHDPLSERGRDLAALEFAGGGKPQTRLLSGKGVEMPDVLKKETAEYAGKQAGQRTAAEQAKLVGEQFDPDVITHPIDAVTDRAVTELGPAAKRRLENIGHQIQAEKRSYYATPEGRTPISVKNIGDEALLFVKEKKTPRGQPIPLVDTTKIDKVVWEKMVDEDRTKILRAGLAQMGKRPAHKPDPDMLQKMLAGDDVAHMSATEARALAGDLGSDMSKRAASRRGFLDYIENGRDVSMVDGNIVAWKKLNAENVDDMIAAIDDAAKASAKKAGVIPPGFKEMQRSARDLRDQFRWPEDWWDKPRATIQTDAGRFEVSGWSALRHNHGLMKQEQENILYAVGKPGVSPGKYRPDISLEQKQALASKVRQMGSPNSAEFDKTFRELLKDDPQGLQWLLDASATNAYVRFTGSKPRVAIHGGSPTAWAPASFEWLGLHADPIFRGLGKMSGHGAGAGTIAAKGYGTPAERRERDVSRLPQEGVSDMVDLFRRFGDALNRGVFDDMVERGE